MGKVNFTKGPSNYAQGLCNLKTRFSVESVNVNYFDEGNSDSINFEGVSKTPTDVNSGVYKFFVNSFSKWW